MLNNFRKQSELRELLTWFRNKTYKFSLTSLRKKSSPFLTDYMLRFFNQHLLEATDSEN